MKLIRLLLLSALATVPVFEARAQTVETDPLNKVLSEIDAGHTDKAITVLNEVIRKNPDLDDAYLLRSNLRIASGDAYGALNDINKVIQLKPNMGSAYHARAVIRLNTKDLKGAFEDLDSAIARDYKGDHVYALRGQIRSGQGDLKGALSDFDDAIKLNPNNPQTYGSRAGVLMALEDRDRALSDLDYLLKWYETDPTKKYPLKPINEPPKPSSDAASNKGGSGPFTVGDNSQRANAAPGDKEMIPVIANAYLNRGLVNGFRQKNDEAIADFTKAIRLDSTNPWAFYHRANELEARGDLPAALADASRAIQIDPMNGNLRVEHGVILVLMGKNSEAQVDFNMLLNADRALWQKRIEDRLATVKKKVPAERK